ncbi:MAG: arginine--tRNA ligase, partial [Planctomycetes bacterium]|nr:arginine--tRNA ligase [Planctomycetota bacterium]
DVIARVLGFEGHDVIRQNHVGDWGTQFGMLIVFYGDRPVPSSATHDDPLAVMADDYRAAQERFKSDEAFANEARAAVGRLQSGDEQARGVWRKICEESRKSFTDIYGRLNVLLEDADVCGESFYNERLSPVIEALSEKLPPGPGSGSAAELREHDGALCVYCYDEKGAPRFKKADGQELPMIVRKSDGAFLYATTDMAAIRYRIEELGARRIIYVTDARQKLHFEMFFAAARAMGWLAGDVLLKHVTFGSVLGENRRPLKTREGANISLSDLLDEAVKRAYQVFDRRNDGDDKPESKRPELPEAEKREIARRVGIAAVKYADLSHDRNKDYVFDWNRMLAMQGNTAPYMMYAYARIRSIYRKAAEQFGAPDVYAADVAINLDEDAERALALRLARFREMIDGVASDLAAHTLCGYLFETASDFMRFYEACPVLKAADEATRLRRMRLCDLTARTLRLGLALLGIEVIERM